MPSFEEFCEQINRNSRSTTTNAGNTIKFGAPWMLLLFFGLMVAKLAPLGNCANLPWWLVTMPLWFGFAFIGVILGLIIVFGLLFFIVAGFVAMFRN